jgi:hypothetical protein
MRLPTALDCYVLNNATLMSAEIEVVWRQECETIRVAAVPGTKVWKFLENESVTEPSEDSKERLSDPMPIEPSHRLRSLRCILVQAGQGDPRREPRPRALKSGTVWLVVTVSSLAILAGDPGLIGTASAGSALLTSGRTDGTKAKSCTSVPLPALRPPSRGSSRAKRQRGSECVGRSSCGFGVEQSIAATSKRQGSRDRNRGSRRSDTEPVA